MELKVINSNSLGNAYILENNQEALLIECGLTVDKIKQALNFNLRKLVGCLVTHEHGDHIKGVHGLLKSAVNVFASKGTHEAIGTITHHRAKILKSGQQIKIGNFRVLPFDVKHDVAEPLGFLIDHPETGTVLFLTDSLYSEYKFRNLNNIIIEANHCYDILDQNVASGKLVPSLRERIVKSHMSINTCKDLLRANDLSKVNNIVLIHLSNDNSNAAKFKSEIERVSGKQVFIAESGLKIPFNKNPF